MCSQDYATALSTLKNLSSLYKAIYAYTHVLNTYTHLHIHPSYRRTNKASVLYLSQKSNFKKAQDSLGTVYTKPCVVKSSPISTNEFLLACATATCFKEWFCLSSASFKESQLALISVIDEILEK